MYPLKMRDMIQVPKKVKEKRILIVQLNLIPIKNFREAKKRFKIQINHKKIVKIQEIHLNKILF